MTATDHSRVTARLRGVAGRTRRAVAAALTARDGHAAFWLAGVSYVLIYLVGVGDLGRGSGDWGVYLVSEPLARATASTGPFRYEAVATVDLGAVTYLLSPGNLAIAVLLGGLVGANAAVSLVSWRRPGACGVESSAALVGGVPALLGGAACCGPVILLVVGIQATGALLTAFAALVPVAVVLLVGSLVLVGTRAEFV